MISSQTQKTILISILYGIVIFITYYFIIPLFINVALDYGSIFSIAGLGYFFGRYDCENNKW